MLRAVKRFAKLYFRALFQGSASLWRVFGFVLGAGVYTVAVWLAGQSLPVALAALVLAVLVAGQVGALRIAANDEQVLAKLTEAGVPPEHREQLHEQLRSVLRTVLAGRVVEHEDDTDWDVFGAHFPDLGPVLSSWDEAVLRKARSGPALRTAFDEEGERRGLPTAEYDDWDALLNDLSDIATKYARAGDFSKPVEFEWSTVDYSEITPPGLPGGGIEIRLGRGSVAHVAAQPPEAVHVRYKNVCRQVEDLYGLVASGPAAVEVHQAYEALERMKPALRDEITALLKVSVVRVSVDCPTCRRNLNLPARPGSDGPGASK